MCMYMYAPAEVAKSHKSAYKQHPVAPLQIAMMQDARGLCLVQVQRGLSKIESGLTTLLHLRVCVVCVCVLCVCVEAPSALPKDTQEDRNTRRPGALHVPGETKARGWCVVQVEQYAHGKCEKGECECENDSEQQHRIGKQRCKMQEAGYATAV
jgi:hypothetical protein